MKDKINNGSLYDLLSARCDFESELIKLDKQLIELSDISLIEKIQKISFDNLDELIKIKSNYKYSIINQHFKDLLKNNIINLVARFVTSHNWANAKYNISLLVEIADILTSEQWKSVLDAFCTNNQIYGCPYRPSIASIFISLFQDSVKNSGIVQPYWLDFRKNLDRFTNDKDINQLKTVIDSTQL